MLSRFDAIFVLLDRPDELLDQALSEHIMALHSGEAARRHTAVRGAGRGSLTTSRGNVQRPPQPQQARLCPPRVTG
jgi:DNA helicase MCM8